MLSDQNRPVIKATLPVVGRAHRRDPQRFYRRMFADHPELRTGRSTAATRPTANSSRHWPDRSPRTPARWSEAGTRAGGLLRRIAHKHASLGIRPEQYKVVHNT